MSLWTEVIINLAFAWLASVGFGLTINVPHRALILCGVSGSAGWIVYWSVNQIGVGRLGANFLGALCVGVLDIIFARIKNCPVIIFNIPGIVPLVPGVPAYQAVRAMVEGQLSNAEDLILRVIIVTVGIASVLIWPAQKFVKLPYSMFGKLHLHKFCLRECLNFFE